MSQVVRALLLGLVLAASVAGCRTAPVLNVENAPVVANKTPTMQDVQSAITRAGAALGWKIEPVKPGLMQGTLNLRTHTAVVEIPYSTTAFSIRYKDSANLNYTGDSIHSNYNGWVQNLEKGIVAQLKNL